MRVIAGRLRSRLIKSVPGLHVRPTPDRLREALFNVLAPRIEGVIFLDAYAGSGSVGIEALSRGARHAIFIERNAQALGVLRENLEKLGLRPEATVLRGKAPELVGSRPSDIAFLDPPYERTSEYKASLEALSKTGCGLVVAQHSSRLTLEDTFWNLKRVRVLRQGDNALSFYEPSSGE